MSEAETRIRLHPFTRAVAGALRRRCGVSEPGAKLVVAVSGGCDSVALLRALAAIAPARTWRLQLTVVHVNHGVRAEADADARFVASLAGNLALPATLTTLDPATFVGNVEAAMRRARYAALHDAAERAGVSAVVVAHHADDQLETMLLRLARGTGLRGLTGLRWRRPLQPRSPVALLRPMLAATRASAEAFLADIGQPWREDATNLDRTRTRARLRHDVLPVLRQVHGRAADHAVALGDRLQAVDRFITRQRDALDRQVVRRPGRACADRAMLRQADPAVLAPLLHGLLCELADDADAIGAHVIHPIVRAIRDTTGGQRQFRAGGVQVTLTRHTLRLVRIDGGTTTE